MTNWKQVPLAAGVSFPFHSKIESEVRVSLADAPDYIGVFTGEGGDDSIHIGGAFVLGVNRTIRDDGMLMYEVTEAWISEEALDRIGRDSVEVVDVSWDT